MKNSYRRFAQERLDISGILCRFLLNPRFLFWCFVIFLAIRAVVLFALPVRPTSDAAWYVARGMEIAAGQGYHEGPVPTAFWPVGYPAFLAAVFYIFGPHVIVAKIANLILSCGIFFIIYCLAIQIFSILTARLAVLIITFYPNQIAYTGALLSEMLVTFTVLLGILIFIEHDSYWRRFIAAEIFGFSALVKAQMLFVPLILFGLYAFHSRVRARLLPTAGLIALAMACVILPWSARNYKVFHEFILISTNGGRTFLSGNNPQARGDNTPHNSLGKDVHFSVADQVAADQRAYALGIDWIKRNPGRFLELIPLKIWRLWAPDGEGEWWFQRGYANYNLYYIWFRSVRVLNQFYYAVLLLGTGVAIWRLYSSGEARRPWTTIGVWLAIYITAVAIVFSGQSRFHFPLMPWVCIYVGWLVAKWMNHRYGFEDGMKVKHVTGPS